MTTKSERRTSVSSSTVCCVHSTYTARGEGGQAIVINFITVQGGGGGQKRPKTCVRTMYTAPHGSFNIPFEQMASTARKYLLVTLTTLGNRGSKRIYKLP